MMKRLIAPNTVIIGLLFGALYSLVLVFIGEMAVSIWGRPRGVAYGLLGHSYWLGLSICGFAMVFVFRAVPLKYSLPIFLFIITAATLFLLPNRGERPFLSVYTGAIMMCLALAAWEHYRVKRHVRNG